jgi:hypothetical protein
MPVVSQEFIKRLLKKGYSEAAIRDVLKDSGFSRREIEDALAAPQKKTAEAPQARPALPRIQLPKLSLPSISDKQVMHVAFVAELALILMFAFALPALVPEGAFTGFFASESPVLPATVDCKYDLDCFKAAAEACGSVVVFQNLQDTVLSFEAENCVLTKSIASFGPSEPPQVIELLSGKTMACRFAPGFLPSSLLSGLATGASQCSGPLKDALYQLAGK